MLPQGNGYECEKMFGTKAETLERLEGKLNNAEVLPQIRFCVREWELQKKDIWIRIQKKLGRGKLVVRSSAINEDTATQSMAGKYDSVVGVSNQEEFNTAVDTVIASYGTPVEEDQILVQPMLTDVAIAGVAFTLEPSTLGNYYVINYDDSTGSTSSVTSGNVQGDKLLYVFKGKEEYVSETSKLICTGLKELEEIFQSNKLDVEFAIDKSNKMYIFQVRPLCVEDNNLSVAEQARVLNNISKKIQQENKKKPLLYGDRVAYGVMPDWNPAEMIGIRPKPLALSLYKEIITDSTWAYQRDNYGYCNMRSFPLMLSFYGMPYIDVRVSFNSFVPANLKADLGEKLVNYYLEQLEENPNLHDKIEFEIAFTCYTLDLPERIQCLQKHGFSKEEIEEITDSLREMTKIIIDNEEGLWKKDYKKIEILEARYEDVVQSDLDNISKIYWLLEYCRRYGTLPFAGLARAGFIAVQLLNSLVNKEIISADEYQDFMREQNTVSSMLKADKKYLSKEAFLKKYGHLRPGTYDICSKRYDEAEDIYFDWNNESESKLADADENKKEFRLSLEQMRKLQSVLKEHGMSDNILDFFHFIKSAIEGREYAKFVFTKSLSEAIKLMAEVGAEYGISKEECSFADIGIIKKLYASSLECEEILKDSIEQGKRQYHITKSLSLPPLIFREQDVFEFYYMDTQPNYVTLDEAVGEVYILNSDENEYDIEDKIVMISSADPGYDWIFSHKIKGFITKFGGANSHMAIRANELGIPAAIGVGEKMFESLCKTQVLQIDASGRRVNILR